MVNQRNDMLLRLRSALREQFNLDVNILDNSNELLFYGLDSLDDELKAILFTHGFISGWNERNNPYKYRIHDPEAS